MSRIAIADNLAQAQRSGDPVVLLDSMLLTYGLGFPTNAERALELEDQIARSRVLPVFAAMLEGRILLGLSAQQLRDLAARRLAKIGPSDLAVATARRVTGVMTVGALLIIARQVGISTIGTGGLGGLHRGLPDVVDISSDLTELARSPVAVVCSGAKAILDLPNTVELLETLGVPVLGFNVDSLPGYWTRETGLAVTTRVATADEVAEIWRAQRELDLPEGLLVANPAPGAGLDPRDLQRWIDEAQAQARTQAIRGKDLTPFLQKHLQQRSGGETVSRTLELLTANCLLAADISRALGGRQLPAVSG